MPICFLLTQKCLVELKYLEDKDNQGMYYNRVRVSDMTYKTMRWRHIFNTKITGAVVLTVLDF